MSLRGRLKRLAKRSLAGAGYALVKMAPSSADVLDDLAAAKDALRPLYLRLSQTGVTTLELAFVEFCCRHWLDSRAQRFQDLFVQFLLAEKQCGFFVEFGATDGLYLSNTYALEAKYGWHGILAEPGKIWHSKLTENRKCVVDTRCLWSKSGQVLEFNEVRHPGLSTIDSFSNSDRHAKARAKGRKYLVDTVSLDDLLDEYDAPPVVEYLSIDTEGSELEILSGVDFQRRKFSIITVEHNFASTRRAIQELLESKGYARIFARLSGADDWFVDPELQAAGRGEVATD